MLNEADKKPNAEKVLIGIRGDDARHKHVYSMRESITVAAYFHQSSPPGGAHVNFHIKNSAGGTVFCSVSDASIQSADTRQGIEVTLAIPATFLNSGRYTVSLYLTSFCPTIVHAHWDDAIAFEIENDIPFILHQGFNQRLPGDILLNNPGWNVSRLTTPLDYLNS
jgi:hypothetical protein